MTTVYIADTGVFVRCGGPDRDKFQRLRRAVRQAGVSLYIPQRVYEELGGDPAADEYPSGNMSYPDGFEAGWIVVIATPPLDAYSCILQAMETEEELLISFRHRDLVPTE